MNILTEAGFDTKESLELITKDTINEIERYINENRFLTANSIYEHKPKFEFLPGHRALLLSFPSKIQSFKEQNEIDECNGSTTYSFILKSLIETAESNANKLPKANRFNDVIKYFSIYIYLHCGRACYDTLSSNLPIPQSDTICKSMFIIYYEANATI